MMKDMKLVMSSNIRLIQKISAVSLLRLQSRLLCRESGRRRDATLMMNSLTNKVKLSLLRLRELTTERCSCRLVTLRVYSHCLSRLKRSLLT